MNTPDTPTPTPATPANPANPANPGLTRYRYDRVPLTPAQSQHAREYQLAYMDKLVKDQRTQLDAATMARTKLRQSKLDTHRVVLVPVNPGDPGYDEASPAHPQDALRGTFEWVDQVDPLATRLDWTGDAAPTKETTPENTLTQP